MGVRASLTVSIINEDRLWGLIACHHETPRRISASTATAVELFAQVFSTQIEAKQQKDELAYRDKARSIHDQLIASMEPEETIFQNLRRFSALLKDMIGCATGSASGAKTVWKATASSPRPMRSTS